MYHCHRAWNAWSEYSIWSTLISVAVLAQLSLTSLQIFLIFIIKKYFLRIKVSLKNYLILKKTSLTLIFTRRRHHCAFYASVPCQEILRNGFIWILLSRPIFHTPGSIYAMNPSKCTCHSNVSMQQQYLFLMSACFVWDLSLPHAQHCTADSVTLWSCDVVLKTKSNTLEILCSVSTFPDTKHTFFSSSPNRYFS